MENGVVKSKTTRLLQGPQTMRVEEEETSLSWDNRGLSKKFSRKDSGAENRCEGRRSRLLPGGCCVYDIFSAMAPSGSYLKPSVKQKLNGTPGLEPKQSQIDDSCHTTMIHCPYVPTM